MEVSADGETNGWSEFYRGHRVTAIRDERIWRAVFDNVVQDSIAFETSDEAAAWARRRIDARIAEAMYPGLARA